MNAEEISTPVSRARLPLRQLFNMCFGLFGIQIVWGLQNANTSRIFQTLGAEINQLAILWIAAPATGLLVQPIVGHLSDKTWTPLGRRRPYVVAGAISTALALALMANVTTLWVAALMLWVLGTSVNLAMEPFRAFVGDAVADAQRNTAFAVQVFFIGLGAVFASALPWMLAHWFGVASQVNAGGLPDSVRLAFYIGGAGLLISVLWSVVTTREPTPEEFEGNASAARAEPGEGVRPADLQRSGVIWLIAGAVGGTIVHFAHLARELYLLSAFAALFGLAQISAGVLRRAGKRSLGLLEVVEDIWLMPRTLRQLAIVQFFTWFALFALWIYATPAVAAHHYNATSVNTAAYNEAADWVGVLFAAYNGVAAVAALLLPALSARIGRRGAHAVCMGVGALGLAGLVAIDDPRWLWAPIIGIGVAWASILSMPYALLSAVAPPRKMGVYMGIHNLFLVIPQLVAATVLGPLVSVAFGGEAICVLMLAGGCFAVAAVLSLRLHDPHGKRS